MSNNYPNILINPISMGFEYETIIRIKRNEKWYDVTVRDVYSTKNAIEIFKDHLILTKLYWEPMEEGSEMAKRLGFKGPSANQQDIPDDLLDDVNRVKRLKDLSEIMKSKLHD